MPVVFRFGPHRFFFYSNENATSGEPPHIHVSTGDAFAVFWLDPVRLRAAKGYTPAELRRVRSIVVARRDDFLRRWDDFFDRRPTD